MVTKIVHQKISLFEVFGRGEVLYLVVRVSYNPTSECARRLPTSHAGQDMLEIPDGLLVVIQEEQVVWGDVGICKNT